MRLQPQLEVSLALARALRQLLTGIENAHRRVAPSVTVEVVPNLTKFRLTLFEILYAPCRLHLVVVIHSWRPTSTWINVIVPFCRLPQPNESYISTAWRCLDNLYLHAFHK